MPGCGTFWGMDEQRQPMVLFPVRLPQVIVERIRALAAMDGLTPSGLARTLLIDAVRTAERDQGGHP